MCITSTERKRECDGPERSGWRIWVLICLPTVYYVHMWLRDDYTNSSNDYAVADSDVNVEKFDANETAWHVMDIGHNSVHAMFSSHEQNVVKQNTSYNMTGLKDWLMDSLKIKKVNVTTTIRRSATPTPCEVRKLHRSEYKVMLNLNVSHENVSFTELYPNLRIGGYFVPDKCKARHQIAILVPYRGRKENLKIFLYNMHPFLMEQKLEYQIFIVEQFGNDSFNIGRLYNAGYKEIQEYGKWKCIVFHDVDLLPTDRRILYTCPTYPRHMCAAILHRPRYHPLFGGVVAMTPEHFEKANGYSNLFWNWGGEDNDMFWRLRFTGSPVVRYDKRIAKFLSLPHAPQPLNTHRYEILKSIRDRWKTDGSSNIKYRLMSTSLRHLSTHLVVDINPYGDGASNS